MRKSEEKMRKVVLITGSSRGIGRAEALRFSADGYAVAVNYIEREDKAEEVVASFASREMMRSHTRQM